ncbi:MAG: porin family protein [Cardiobacteriaceae bacterium]|nr:porin family protein [Cardiobacteriaceae bacterium]
MKKAVFCLAASLALPAYAVEVAIPQPAAEIIPDNLPRPSLLERLQESSEPLEVSREELLANPEVLARLLDQAVVAQDTNMIRALLPVYRDVPDNARDPQLVRFAEAALASADGDGKQAVALYREMIAADPTLVPVRLHLALALMNDHQDDAARDQFQRLRGEELPDDIRVLVDRSLETLQKRRSWSFSANGYYHHEANINGAPKERERPWGNGKLTFPEQKSANGIYLGIDAEKRFPLTGNLYASLNPSVNADYYWDAKEFNDYRFRLGAGGGYQDARLDLSAEPYASRRVYGGKAYSTTYGTVLGASYWVSPKWRFSASADVNRTVHDSRKHLDGNRYFAGVNALYLYKPTTYFFGGISAFDSNANDPSDAFVRYGLSLGWGQDWPHGISSRTNLSYGRRTYDGADFFAIRRKDNEYGVNVALWNRNWHFWGLTPKLNLSWSKTTSNHFYYGKNNANAFIEISRTF